MILLFLGSWRSTLVIVVSIPLSILVSVIVFSAHGADAQHMTLGGLALAVGILVDDATVEIENIHRNLGMGKPVTRAILDGAQQIAVPAFVSTLCICIVFVPVVFITGVGQVPLHAAGAGRRLRHAGQLLPVAHPGADDGAVSAARRGPSAPAGPRRAADGGWIWSVHQRFNRHFERLQDAYRARARLVARHHRWVVVVGFVGAGRRCRSASSRCSAWTSSPRSTPASSACTCAAPPAPASRRRRQRFATVEEAIRETIPADEIQIVHRQHRHSRTAASTWRSATPRSCRRPTARSWSSLKPEHHGSTPDYVARCAPSCASAFPISMFFFQPADMVTQILELRPAGADRRPDRRPRPEEPVDIARDLVRRIAAIPGAVDVRCSRCSTHRRSASTSTAGMARQLGLTERDVATSLLVSLSGIAQIGAELLAQPEERRELPRRRADARSTASTRSTRSTARR